MSMDINQKLWERKKSKQRQEKFRKKRILKEFIKAKEEA